MKVQQTVIAIGWQFLLFYAFFVTMRDEQCMAEL